MDIKAYNDHCLVQEEVTEQLRFDEKMLVYNGKTLALAHIDIFESIHLKCDPATAIQLREAYAEPLPGHHMHTRIIGIQYAQLGVFLTSRCYEWIDGSCIG